MNSVFKQYYKQKAYTLVELVIVIVVIGLLASISIFGFNSWQKSTSATSVKSDLNQAISAMENFRNFNNYYPLSVGNLSNFKTSAGVMVTGGSVDGKSFCLNAVSSKYPDIQFHINSDSSKVLEGLCGQQVAPSKPSITVVANGPDVQSTISIATCEFGTAQYSARNRTDNGIWSGYSDWSSDRVNSKSANYDTRYSFEAKTRCFVDDNNYSASSPVGSASFVYPIPAPDAPVVVTTNFGDTTVWGWSATACLSGTAIYRFDYSISPTGYDSGWNDINFKQQLSFTTSVIGERHTVSIQQRCSGVNTESEWSHIGAASYKKSVKAPNTPTIAVSLSGSNILATITSSLICSDGSIQYAIRSRVNDGSWGLYSDWSSATTSSRAASDGVKYGYQAAARCYVNAEDYSATVEGLESTYIKSITAPSAPTIAFNTTGISTTWTWSAVACAVGTVNYQYSYTISPAGYNSGWINNGSSLSISMTTNNPGQTHTVQVMARCNNSYVNGAWSVGASASYYRPNVPTLAACAAGSITSASAILCATITSSDGMALSDSGICWGTTPNPTSNCMSFYGSSISIVSGGGVSSAKVQSLAASLDGRNIYSGTTGGVIAYSRNQNTGSLSSVNSVSSSTVNGVAVSPDGKNVYAGRTGSTASFSRNQSDGSISLLNSISSSAVNSVAVSPNGKNVYSGTDSGLIVFARQSDGSISKTSTYSMTTVHSVNVSFDGKQLYVASDGGVSTFAISSDGSISKTASHSSAASYSASPSPDGYALYSAFPGSSNSGGTKMYGRNISSGALTYNSYMSGCSKVDTAVSPDGLSVYSAASCINNAGGTYSFSRSLTGSGLSSVNGDSSAPINALVASPDGKNIYSGISPSTGSGGILVYSRSQNLSLGTYYQGRAWMPSGTTIYYRGFATNSIGTGYSPDSTFTTL